MTAMICFFEIYLLLLEIIIKGAKFNSAVEENIQKKKPNDVAIGGLCCSFHFVNLS